jgi:hypothetical protein
VSSGHSSTWLASSQRQPTGIVVEAMPVTSGRTSDNHPSIGGWNHFVAVQSREILNAA